VQAAAQHARINLSQVIEVLHRNLVAFAPASSVPDVLVAHTEVLDPDRCGTVIPDVVGVQRLKARSDVARFARDIVFCIVIVIEEKQFLAVRKFVQYATVFGAQPCRQAAGQT
jgi:hypothetical protein